jgi:hypothetical protein
VGAGPNGEEAWEDLSSGVPTGNQRAKYTLGGIFPRYGAAYAAIHAIDILRLYPPIGQELVSSDSCSSPLALSLMGRGAVCVRKILIWR